MIEFNGHRVSGVDNRLMALKLVQLGLTGVAMFGPDRRCCSRARSCVRRPFWWSAALSGRPRIVNIDMLESAPEKFEATRP